MGSFRYKQWIVVGVTVLLGALATGFAWEYSSRMERAQLQTRFDLRVAETQTAIRVRFAAYEQVLRSGVALFQASDYVSRDEWRRYVKSLKTWENYPGIQGIGFSEQLSHARLEEHLARVQADGFPDYRVHPLDPERDPTAIVYLEPFDARNQRAFGYDMYSNPVRREAMARARDTGQPALSGSVTLLQETEQDRQVGTLLYLPLYQRDSELDTIEQRRAALLGWVYSAFRMNDLMLGIMGENLTDVALTLYGGTLPNPDAQLYQSAPSSVRNPLALRADVQLDVAGQPWLMSVHALPAFAAGAMSAPTVTLLGGGLLTLMMGALVLVISNSELRAGAIAFEMTEALRNSEERQRAILQNTADGILTIDSKGIVQSLNLAAEHMFGFSAEEVIGNNVSMLMPQRFHGVHDGYVANINNKTLATKLGLRREVIGCRRNGDEFPVWLAVNRMPTRDTREYVGMVSDISERKKNERLLADANGLRQSILECSPVAIISTDAQGLIESVNPAACQLLQYSAEDLIGAYDPVLLHDPQELAAHAADLSRQLQKPVKPGFEALVTRARLGQVEEREWTYLRRDGSAVSVHAAITALKSVSGELTGFLTVAYDITERKKSQAYIQHMAHHDALTGLPNRVLLLDRLEQALEQAKRRHENVAVLMLDLDHFKRINDSLGHHVGDDLLLKVAKRLATAVRRVDTVARMGGDEFVIIAPGMADQGAVTTLVEHVLGRFSEPFPVARHEMIVTPSIGISLYPEDGTDARALLKHADTAMYQAKDAGRGNFKYFKSRMLHHNERRLETENALRKALASEQMSLVFQPQVSFSTGKVVGCEALLRWHHPQLGDVAPDSFVPLAEEMGLIKPIGDWVVRSACLQARAIQTRLGQDLTIAVNISPRQFFQGDLLATVKDALRESGLPAHTLELEITEGVMVKHSEDVITLLRKVRELGVRVSVDDFGTGYSSLSYLTRFPIDKLKIDQSFVRDITVDASDAAVTSAIILMAHTLQLTVIAEGVETLEQCDFLSARKCDVAQGYFFSRPIGAESLIEMVSTGAPIVGVPSAAVLPSGVALH